MNAPDDQHFILYLHFARRIRRQLTARCIDLTRLQRASERPGESARRCRDNVVQRGRMGFEDIMRHLVVFRHRAMYSEENGVLLRGQPCAPKRSLNALDPHLRHVRYIYHADYDTPYHARPSEAYPKFGCSSSNCRPKHRSGSTDCQRVVVLNGPKLRWGPLATGTAQRPTDSRGHVASSFFFVEVALLKGARRLHFAGLPQAGAGSAKNS